MRAGQVTHLDGRQAVRDAACTYELTLDPKRRKDLGQFFTGVPLGKLLAHLALRPDTRTVLDPMAGHGDLLDAACESAVDLGISLARLDGIEIDGAVADKCRDRLAETLPEGAVPRRSILAADAFAPSTLGALPGRGYDLVIANPPYVRYQARNGNGSSVDPARAGLEAAVDSRAAAAERAVWKVLAQSYSGLADLSVPATVLAGLLVRPGGRLALVLPATWRTRDYADAVRYLLLRCFEPEAIVEDTQPGWFSDALVRTNLIVAKRLASEEARIPLSARDRWPQARWLHVAPEAGDGRSLVGAAFGGSTCPESGLASWLRSGAAAAVRGVEARDFDSRQEWAALRSRAGRRGWHEALEGDSERLPLFSAGDRRLSPAIPEPMRAALPPGANLAALLSLEDAGIRVGQGLRTGCNGFFYVTARDAAGAGEALVTASPALGGGTFCVPAAAIRPALRRQAEAGMVERGESLPGRALDLRGWVLPEDAEAVARADSAYAAHGEAPPAVMPPELARFVRRAAGSAPDGSAGGKRIPQLSAVRTNARPPNGRGLPPRFWYMLPDFAPRHLPAAFAPRVNQGTPWVECNTDPPALVDTNFATFWSPDGGWTRFALKALLNSAWCHAFMEAAGTPLGGGALKLEATHLRQMPLPDLSSAARMALDAAGKRLTRDAQDMREEIDRAVLGALMPPAAAETEIPKLAERLAIQARDLCAARQRIAR